MSLFSLVAPTYNEAAGLELFVRKVHEALGDGDLEYELIIVDDNSPDGTAEIAFDLAKDYPLKVLQREGKLGLSSAVIEGWKTATGDILGVIDADLSHDVAILPAMVKAVHNGVEVAVGSRYVPGGGLGDWPWRRRIISRVAVALGMPICPVKDVTSGYLVCSRTVIEGVELDPIGFKIGLEVLVRGNYKTVVEVPYIFKDRYGGKSKFNIREIYNYLVQLKRLYLYYLQHRPVRHRLEWPL